MIIVSKCINNILKLNKILSEVLSNHNETKLLVHQRLVFSGTFT